MQKILVTGCAGFIGSHTSQKLLSQNIEVTGVDNFDPYYSLELKTKNIELLKKHKNFKFFEFDLRDEKQVKEKLSTKFDCIIHLAAKAGVRPSIENPQNYIDSNISATRNLLDLMNDNGIKNMAFASSSSIYGNIPNTPWNEEIDVSQPISPYAFTKKACELMNHTYHHLYHLNIINLRFFTVFGPRQRPDLAINKFTQLLLKGEAIPMYGDGSTSRDYTYIDDIVGGVLKAVNYLQNNDNVFENINLGNNAPTKLIDLINSIAEITGKPLKIKQLPMQPGDVDKTCADITKAQKLLGYQPLTSIKEGLKKFVEWHLKA
ncbi:GDP-mannose 4,6-dehydratase [bacterium]|nr:GDP-mannose 4,6-dehydratase [bacterium]